MSGKVEELERIVNFLRSGSDLQASTVLARLRLGERVEEVAKSVPAMASSSTLSKPPRYACIDFRVLWTQHSGNPGPAYWLRSPPALQEVVSAMNL